MCVDASSSHLFFKGSAPQNGGYRVQWAKRGGASHEREQTTGAPLTKALQPHSLLRGLQLVRWSPMREGWEGERRWARFLREARPGGQAGRADLLLGGDALSHRPLVEGGKPPEEAGCRGAP